MMRLDLLAWLFGSIGGADDLMATGGAGGNEAVAGASIAPGGGVTEAVGTTGGGVTRSGVGVEDDNPVAVTGAAGAGFSSTFGGTAGG